MRKLEEKGIEIVTNGKIKEIFPDGVILEDNRKIDCNVPVWATGAEPQIVSAKSDLALLKGFFSVNDYLQSTSHPNVFAAGDCITMETYKDKNFPPKAGVYAVRGGPFMTQNIINYMTQKPLVKYTPQTGFLALLMTGDQKAIGTKFGIAFTGKWVWNMKNWIDTSFMKMFDPYYLFKDYDTKGYAVPDENGERLDAEKALETLEIHKIREKVDKMSGITAAKLLGCDEEEEEFMERL